MLWGESDMILSLDMAGVVLLPDGSANSIFRNTFWILIGMLLTDLAKS